MGPTTAGNLTGGLALGGYFLGGPIVHFSHGHVGKGFGDLGVRVGAPAVLGFLGGLIGAALYEPSPPPPESASPVETYNAAVAGPVGMMAATAEGMYYGALMGAASAIAIDAALLARETTKPDPAPAAPPTATIRPSVVPSRGGASAGLTGTF